MTTKMNVFDFVKSRRRRNSYLRGSPFAEDYVGIGSVRFFRLFDIDEKPLIPTVEICPLRPIIYGRCTATTHDYSEYILFWISDKCNMRRDYEFVLTCVVGQSILGTPYLYRDVGTIAGQLTCHHKH